MGDDIVYGMGGRDISVLIELFLEFVITSAALGLHIKIMGEHVSLNGGIWMGNYELWQDECEIPQSFDYFDNPIRISCFEH